MWEITIDYVHDPHVVAIGLCCESTGHLTTKTQHEAIYIIELNNYAVFRA